MQRNGTFRWCGKPTRECLRDGEALLEITTDKGVTVQYWVYQGQHETRIKRMDNGEVYAINLRSGYCECQDHQRRQVVCKHVKVLRLALPQLT